MREYTTPTRDRRVVELRVDGRTLSWTKPKDATIALPIVEAKAGAETEAANLRALFDWLGRGLSDEDEQWLEGRLRDEADAFDIEDLNALVEILAEEAAAVPPTSPSASGQQSVNTG